MHVLSKPMITAFIAKHQQSAEIMTVWYHKTKLATWANLNELRAEQSDVDYITNDRYVFNMGSFRIVAMIFFKAQQLYIRGIFTHKAYDKRRAQLPTL